MIYYKIAHIGDAHLGKSQYSIKNREGDFRAALTKCFEAAMADSRTRVIILPGDVFDSPTPSSVDVAHLARLVRTAKAHLITTVGVDGNHDGSDEGSWLEVCDIVRLNKDVRDIHGISFAGISNCRPNVFKAELSKLVSGLLEKGQTLDVFVMHQSVAELCGFTGAELTAQWIAEQLKMIGVKYVAMGDIHDYGLKEFEGIPFCYPGSCEVTAIDERHDKYWVSFKFDIPGPGSELRAEATKMPIATRPIKSYKVYTQDGITEMVTEIRKKYTTHLLVVDVSTEILDGRKTVQRMLRELNVMAKVDTFNPAKDAEADEVVKIPLWERAEASNAVSAAITQSYAPDTNEHQMIVELLNNPLAVTTICKGWLAQ